MRILLVDDHEMLRDGLCLLIEREPDMEVAGQADNGRAAIAQTIELHPDIVVMDVLMPDINGIEATRRVREALPSVKVISLSSNSDAACVRSMFDAGAVGYVVKNAASHELIQAIRAVAEDRTYVSPTVAGAFAGGFTAGNATQRSSRPPPELSPREREVLRHLAEGKTSKEVAVELGIAVSTVETYRRQITTRLGIHSVAELTKYAIRNGLTSLE